MDFECKCCEFTTDKKSHWKKHLKSEPHKHRCEIARATQERNDLLARFQKNELLLQAQEVKKEFLTRWIERQEIEKNRLNIKK